MGLTKGTLNLLKIVTAIIVIVLIVVTLILSSDVPDYEKAVGTVTTWDGTTETVYNVSSIATNELSVVSTITSVFIALAAGIFLACYRQVEVLNSEQRQKEKARREQNAALAQLEGMYDTTRKSSSDVLANSDGVRVGMNLDEYGHSVGKATTLPTVYVILALCSATYFVTKGGDSDGGTE